MTGKELRLIYLEAAKQCHPDMVQGKEGDDEEEVDKRDFRQVTEAYELLQRFVIKGPKTGNDDDDAFLGISEKDEEEFRRACQSWLGIPAEVVEESKRCNIFRNWLDGNTDAAQHWRNFFAIHGGLAPMLRPAIAELESGVGTDTISGVPIGDEGTEERKKVRRRRPT